MSTGQRVTMPLSDYNSPSKVSINTQRLSAMIDSLNTENDDAALLHNEKGSLNDSRTELLTPRPIRSPPKFTPPQPPSLTRSPKGDISIKQSEKRLSFVSNYSGVVQEGIEVSYVVQNPGKDEPKVRDEGEQEEQQITVENEIETSEKKNKKIPILPAFPSEETLKAKSRIPSSYSLSSKTDDVIIQPVANAKPVGRFNSSSSLKQNEQHSSLKLLTVAKHSRDFSSIASGNIASESGSSSYNPNTKNSTTQSTPQNQTSNELSHTRTTSRSTDHHDDDYQQQHEDMVSAHDTLPELQTEVYSNEEGKLPIRTETTTYNPSIPPRSKNRPKSSLMIKESLGNLEKELKKEMELPDMKKSFESPSKQLERQLEAQADEELQEPLQDTTYLGRPLPDTPKNLQSQYGPKITNIVDDETSANTQSFTKYNVTNPIETTSSEASNNISPGTEQKWTKRKSSKNKHSRKNTKSFDIGTLSQLLNVGKGTLLGSEFSNLGMQPEEKRALEKLVDSLSKLTADMVLDPERYEEGLRRLEKATRSLEGF